MCGAGGSRGVRYGRLFLRTPRVNACVLMSESALEATHPAHELGNGPAARCLCVDYGNQIVRCRALEDRSCFGAFPKNFRPGLRREARASSQIPPLAQPLVDVVHKRGVGLRPQIGFALAEGKRVKSLRVRPHNAKAEADVVAIRGREDVALRNARVRRGVVPRAATDHPDRACRGAYRITR